ncbi:MAG: response regulator [Planktotalea sp.]|uniref:response regulator n=1 Tax=Planktotalea sp. TaxID=2029877 RepID=UPI003C768FBC
MDGTVLVADDDRTIRTVLTQALTRAGCKVHATSSLTTLMRWVAEGRGDVVISDVMMPDGNGLEMLPKIHEDRPGLPVIIISAQNTIMTAIKANEADSYDYLPKPFDLPDLMKRTARALASRNAKSSAQPIERATADELPLVGQTPVMQALYNLIARVMNTDIPVLITGESGTGKTAIAHAIHDFSDRRTLPFITMTTADLQDIEGPARALARAKGGTLLIEEIADIDLAAQARLVRMMDAPGDHVPRFLATSLVDLASKLESGGLRQDLYYRLGGATLSVPALRERVDDIEVLARHFLAKSEQDGAMARALSPEAAKLIHDYSWPGNVRQLENAMRRLGLTARTDAITRAEVEMVLGSQPNLEPVLTGEMTTEKLSASVERHLRRYFDLHGGSLPPAGIYARILREFEQPLIEISLEATGGNQAKCADLLGINRNTLRKKITDLDIRVTRQRKLM